MNQESLEEQSTRRMVFVIEDEMDIQQLMVIQLEKLGHSAKGFTHAEQAINNVEEGNMPVDLFVIDWMLPGMSGLELCQQLRQREGTKKTPILMVTALSQTENIVAGLDAGADDYVTKPFDLAVFQARVKALLRRSPKISTGKIRYGELELSVDKAEVRVAGNPVHLTSTEFRILGLLAQKPGHVFTREKLINSIQGEQIYVTSRTVDTHIAGLRKKLGKSSEAIETIRGIGYRFKESSP